MTKEETKQQKPTHPALNIAGVSGSRVLRLSITKSAFEITGTEEKMFELRHKGKWIDYRLISKPKNGVRLGKDYDYVLLTNGYSNKSPWKLFIFKGVESLTTDINWKFSNGLEFATKKGDHKIHFSQLIASGGS